MAKRIFQFPAKSPPESYDGSPYDPDKYSVPTRDAVEGSIQLQVRIPGLMMRALEEIASERAFSALRTPSDIVRWGLYDCILRLARRKPHQQLPAAQHMQSIVDLMQQENTVKKGEELQTQLAATVSQYVAKKCFGAAREAVAKALERLGECGGDSEYRRVLRTEIQRDYAHLVGPAESFVPHERKRVSLQPRMAHNDDDQDPPI